MDCLVICAGDQTFAARTGSFIFLPRDIPHAFLVGSDQRARLLQMTTPGGFEQFHVDGHHRYYSVGRQYARDDVHVCFDPHDRNFVFFLVDESPSTVGPEIARRPARFLTVEEITGLNDDNASIGPQQLRFAFPESSRGQLLMSN
jgi:hypothetical protein